MLFRSVPPGWLYAGFKLIRPEQEPAEIPGEQADAPAGAASEPAERTIEEAAAKGATEARPDEEPILYWFFFPLAAGGGAALPANVVAWEATSRSGRATYFFRLLPSEQAPKLRDGAKAPGLIDAAIRQLNRAIVLLNFRREPIYLPDDSLELQPRFRRDAIACRKIPELRRLRASFLGRAIHTSPQAWQREVDGLLQKADV